MYYVYILKSIQANRYYVGCSTNLEERLKNHNRGSTTSTKPYRPWQLVHQEVFDNKQEALRRERQIKRFKGGEGLKRLLRSGS